MFCILQGILWWFKVLNSSRLFCFAMKREHILYAWAGLGGYNVNYWVI